MSTLNAPPPPHPSGAAKAPVAHGHGAGAAALPFHFVLRRLHSVAGILFGGYIVVHLTVNATGWWPQAYQANVDRIHSLGPLLPVVEIVTIFAPLLLHMIYGVYIGFVGVKFNTTAYNYGGNVRYFLQRWTAVILLAFILFHIGTLHKWGIVALAHLVGDPKWLSGLGGLFDEHNAFKTTVYGIQTYFSNQKAGTPANIAVMGLYLLGIWSACFHFANGLWTAAIAWGLTVTAGAQRRWGNVCCALGIVMLVIGTTAWAAFTISPETHWDGTQVKQVDKP